jgi:hypothetical protein
MLTLASLSLGNAAWVPFSPVARVADNSPPRQFLFREPSVGFHSPLPGLADNGRPRRSLVRQPRVSSPLSTTAGAG